MTMLDDETLSALLHQVGDSFAIPPSGVADTVRRVRQSDNANDQNDAVLNGHTVTTVREDVGERDAEEEELASRSIRKVIRTHLWLSVAASLIVLLALAGGAFLLGTSSSAPKITTASGTAAPAAIRHAPSQKRAASGTGVSANASAAAPTPSGAATTGGATATSLPAGSVGQPARIAQTGSLTLTVARGALTATMNKLTSLASAYGGFVANSQTEASGSGSSSTSSTNGASAMVTLQIPVANFSPLLAAAKALGHVSGLTTKATDVTSQYVDLQSRITALQASRQQYLTIMTKASSVGDVLAVQAQLDNLQSQIEQLQGQLAVLQSETDYSTLTVAVGGATRHHRHVTKPAASGIVKAWKDSLHGFAVGVDGIIRLAGPAFFALLCLVALVLGGRLTWRRLQRHNL